jgi:hypothetical protein
VRTTTVSLGFFLSVGACAGSSDPHAPFEAEDGGPEETPDTGQIPTTHDTDAGSVDSGAQDGPTGPEPIGNDVPHDVYLKLEAENGVLSGSAIVEPVALASGAEVVELGGDGSIDFVFSVDVTAAYELIVTGGVPVGRGSKHNGVFANDERQGQVRTDEAANFYAHPGMWLPLEAGENVISLRAEWGWTRFDFIELRPIRSRYLEVSAEPRNARASDGVRRLMRFLVDQYGRSILSGQQDAASAETVRALTGKAPAVLGVDLMDYSPSRVERQGLPAHGAIEDALDAFREGAIITAAWHWNAPSGLVDDVYTDESGQLVDASWYRGFYTYATTFDVRAAMADSGSQAYQLLVRDIDAIAAQLVRLRDARVPVLFRPLHEASGGWFWWGAEGPAPYLELWHLIYDRLTHHHELDNLIWVWNGQSVDWYPGDETVDVVSEDIYDGARNHAAQLARFGQATQYAGSPRLVALSENGALLDPERVGEVGPTWSWFCTWSGAEYVESGVWNERAMFEKVYASQLVLTRDELPDLASYPLGGKP